MKKDSSSPGFIPFGCQHYGIHHLLMAILIGVAFYVGAKIGTILSLQLLLVGIVISLIFLVILMCERMRSKQKLLEQTQELMKTNNALIESGARYASLYDNLPDMYAFVDAETCMIRQCNRTLADKLGYSKDEIIGQLVFEIYHKEFVEEAKRVFHSFVETSEVDKDKTELQLKRRDGGKIDVNLNVSSIRDERGKIICICLCWIDITDSKRAVTSLKEGNGICRSIFNTVLDAMFIINKNGDILENNMAACGTYGYKQEELLHMNVSQLIDPEYIDGFHSFVNAIDKDGFFQGETINVRKDGSTLHVEVRGTTITFQDEESFIVIVKDISMRKQAEKEKAKLEILLRQAQKMEAIGTLAGGIAHDFNNILVPILGFTEIMMSKVDKEDNSRLIFLEKIYNATLRAKDLVKQILSFTRQKEKELQPIQPHLVIKEAIKFLRASIPSTIEMRTEIDEVGTVLADPTQIHQIIMNLCTNAYYAMKNDGGILSISLSSIVIDEDDIKITSSGMTPGAYVKIVVCDTGKGISDDLLGKIFDPYFTTKEKDGGTGQGLSIVQGIVKDYKGHISVNSEVGHGTTFDIYLPQHQPESKNDKRIAVSQLPTGTENVMIVDDDESIVNVIYSIIQNLGYKGKMFTSSTEALNAFIAEPDTFDLMITDMTMPQMTGIQLSEKVFSKRKNFPIILCTGFSDLVDEQKAKDMGIKGFLYKPILIEVFAKKIREVLDMSKVDTQ